MIVFWRGWAGAAGFMMTLFSALFGLAAGISADKGGAHGLAPLMAGCGALIGGAATWFMGQHVNKKSVPQQVDKKMEAEKLEMDRAVATGQLRAPEGMPQPRTLAEAHQLAAALLENKRAHWTKTLTNHHHFWFIPIQFVGLIGAVVGLVLVGVGIVTMVS